jgi:hypothetical protein
MVNITGHMSMFTARLAGDLCSICTFYRPTAQDTIIGAVDLHVNREMRH